MRSLQSKIRSQEMTSICVKVTFESQGRVTNKLFELNPSDFGLIDREVKKAFPEAARLAWKDHEGDLVELESQKDLDLYLATKPTGHRWWAFAEGGRVSPERVSPERVSQEPSAPGRVSPSRVDGLPKLTRPPAVEFVPLSEREATVSLPPRREDQVVPLPKEGGSKKVAMPKLNARFVKHVTADDETSEYAPGTKFFKTWRFRNDGTLKWPTKISLLYVSKLTGDQLDGPDEMPILFPSQTEIGAQVDISVPLVAPEKPGEYTGFWKLCDESGRKFGQRVRVRIFVVERVSNIVFTESVKRILETLEEEGYVDGIETATHYLVNREVRTFDAIEKKLGDLGIRVSV